MPAMAIQLRLKMCFCGTWNCIGRGGRSTTQWDNAHCQSNQGTKATASNTGQASSDLLLKTALFLI